ncbi:protein hook [Coccinella septempunctata]|uniref:protein hook n=1 Tax=Coccinella septempunctata TaxID=41139 RepID=UPI001D063CE1|nr:protein hook [Coccinella septempunctata]
MTMSQLKMDQVKEMCKSLCVWLETVVPSVGKNFEDLADGVAITDALVQISPENFEKLLPKIKKDAGCNWRLRVSNLKKILHAVIEYYQDVLSLQLQLDAVNPDVVALGEKCDIVQLTKLLQLVLGCAINCDRKQDYITTIMQLEESVQQNIMQAIQQLEDVTLGSGRSGISLLLFDTETKNRLISELETAKQAKDSLSQQCLNLEQQIQILIDEKQNLVIENDNLKEIEKKYKDSRRQIEKLKEELFKDEVQKDDYKSKIIEQEKQIMNYLEKISELTVAASATSRLKDEIDALSESALKVQDLEMTVNSYKKRLEKYQDIKKKMQKLEEKNMEYLQKNLEYEEELQKVNIWKNQCETYKQQLNNIQQKLDEEIQRADKAEYTVEKLESKLLALQGEKDRLIIERDVLKDENEDLKFGRPAVKSGAAMSEELTPTEMKERLRFLEKENKSLRGTCQEAEAKQTLLDNALGRIEKLQQINRNSTQTILKLETQIEELTKNDQKNEAQENAIKEYKHRILMLQESLNVKENEFHALQTRYNRNIEKAREVAQHLDSKSNGTVDILAQQAHVRELENKLIATGFYRLSLNCHQEAMDERIAAMSTGQGQTFLARQRQATPRKQIQRFKSK